VPQKLHPGERHSRRHDLVLMRAGLSTYSEPYYREGEARGNPPALLGSGARYFFYLNGDDNEIRK